MGGRQPIPCKGKIAILVDDGIATGLTIKAAIKELKMHYRPKKIIVCTPVIPAEIAEELVVEGIEVLAVIVDKSFLGSVGAYYQDFYQVKDQDVVRVIKQPQGS